MVNSIFLSHTRKDKPLVEPIALRLSQVFGSDNIFYDSWSIQPGEGIIEKMNEALSRCKFFFLFASKNSLTSEMVKLEWHNSILRATRGDVKIIPVKLDDCSMPTILLQNLYIDFYARGHQIALRQMIDVINGENTYREGEVQKFENIRAYIEKLVDGYKIEFRTEAYMEPQSIFLILLENEEHEVECKVEGISLPTRFVKNIERKDGNPINALIASRANATSPGFPFRVTITSKTGTPIKLCDLGRAISQDKMRPVPIVEMN
jgi:hypothetical protein